jgi:hypothetical protein
MAGYYIRFSRLYGSRALALPMPSLTLKAMEVYFGPDLQAKIDQLVIEIGRAADKRSGEGYLRR